MTASNRHALKVFSGNAHPALAKEICGHLGVPLGQAYIGRFPDGEVRLQILENVRGADVFLIQPTCRPVNDTLMELLILIDAFRRASADRITAVVPYYGYARQDRKDRPRVFLRCWTSRSWISNEVEICQSKDSLRPNRSTGRLTY